MRSFCKKILFSFSSTSIFTEARAIPKDASEILVQVFRPCTDFKSWKHLRPLDKFFVGSAISTLELDREFGSLSLPRQYLKGHVVPACPKKQIEKLTTAEADAPSLSPRPVPPSDCNQIVRAEPEDNLRVSLLNQAGELYATFVHRNLVDIVKIGSVLLKAKETTAHGDFSQQVEELCPFSYRTANNYMTVARHFSDHCNLIAMLPISTIYKLASETIPDSERQDVLARYQRGEIRDAEAFRREVNVLSKQNGGKRSSSMAAPATDTSATMLAASHMRSDELCFQDAMSDTGRTKPSAPHAVTTVPSDHDPDVLELAQEIARQLFDARSGDSTLILKLKALLPSITGALIAIELDALTHESASSPAIRDTIVFSREVEPLA